MRTQDSQTILRQDYKPYPYLLSSVCLEFDLAADITQVHSEMVFRLADGARPGSELVLDGKEIELVEIRLDGDILPTDQYRLEADTLVIQPPVTNRAFVISIRSRCFPARNSSLMGLYVSGDKLFTQCEAQGFRRICWFPDRPDVMSGYTVILRADPAQYPLLLSNGNLLKHTSLPDGRHQATWQDPFPKPSYLFALVAGDFDCLERTETTSSGRQVLLQIYSDKGCREQTHWAMDCLARALHWDESRFGLELDLDRFMVVAARDFNMGAMENKGLNIFNAAYVLADPASATDAAYRAIESVIGHEYFHNWTGNRVTCRDWFQLSLKEGLTVFRDQEFSADMMAQGLQDHEAASARAVKRIDDVMVLRNVQFPEDAGPMAHPIRPDSYQEISNFYTATVYEKGAEVIRMQHSLLGEDGFRAGLDEYFRRHDGQAVTCDDFLDAMDTVYTRARPGQNLDVFRRWYSQAGTPRVSFSEEYDPASCTLRISLGQHNPPAGLEKQQADSRKQPLPTRQEKTPGAASLPSAGQDQSIAPDKPPLHIPVAIGLLDENGRPMPVEWQGGKRDTVLLELRQKTQSWTFSGIESRPTVSLLRAYSAPVIIETRRSASDLALLACHDPDYFARWDACQQLAMSYLSDNMRNQSGTAAPGVEPGMVLAIWQASLEDGRLDSAYRARLLALPDVRELINRNEPLDPVAAAATHQQARKFLGQSFASQWLDLHLSMSDRGKPYSPDPVSSGRRELRNLALGYLLAGEHPDAVELARAQFHAAENMSESLGALSALLYDAPQACAGLLAEFHARWQHDDQVIDRWFAIQASAPSCDVSRVRALMAMPDFNLRNPNRARSVVFRFCLDNHQNLHTREGYDYWVEQTLQLDALNPEIAARLARAFDNWARHEPVSRSAMHAALLAVHNSNKLSPNVHEIVSRALELS